MTYETFNKWCLYIAYALIIGGLVIGMPITAPLALLFIIIGIGSFVAIMALGMYLAAKGLDNKYDNVNLNQSKNNEFIDSSNP